MEDDRDCGLSAYRGFGGEGKGADAMQAGNTGLHDLGGGKGVSGNEGVFVVLEGSINIKAPHVPRLASESPKFAGGVRFSPGSPHTRSVR